ncbi:MAG: hypothetical protein ACXADH_19120 [Candidatus Kariarchaeaceae archaeon]|jgi:hypothetical protein
MARKIFYTVFLFLLLQGIAFAWPACDSTQSTLANLNTQQVLAMSFASQMALMTTSQTKTAMQ